MPWVVRDKLHWYVTAATVASLNEEALGDV